MLMKKLTHLLFLFLLLMATGKMSAAEITSVTLNNSISMDNNAYPEDMRLFSWVSSEDLDLTKRYQEGVSVFVLNSFTAQTTGTLTSVVMKARLYESGTTAPSEWQTLTATAGEEEGSWTCEANYNLLDGLTYHKTYQLEFYFEGTDDQNSTCYFKNGESNFIVTFYTGGMSMMDISYVEVFVKMGTGTQTQQIPQSGMPVVDLSSESETDFMVAGFNAYTNGLQSLKMNYCIYPASSTASEWKSMTATVDAENPGKWVCSTSVDVLDGLTVGETYVLEFNFQGSGTFVGQDCWYNNGGSNYMIRFTKAEKEVGFLDGETAGFRLSVNGTATDYTLTGEGTRTPATASLGNLSTLTCDAAWLKAQLLKSGLTFSSIQMAYVIYGSEYDKNGNWYYVDLTESADQGSGVTQFSSSGDAVDLLEYRKNQWYLYEGNDYTLEVRYVLRKADGTKYYLEGGDAYKFTFTYMGESTYVESATLNMTINNSTQNIVLPKPEEKTYMETVNMLRLNSVRAVYHETEFSPLTEVFLSYRVYLDGQHESATWQQIAMQEQTDGTWTLSSAFDFLSGLIKGQKYCMEYEVVGRTDNGNANTGTYEIRFTMGDPAVAVRSVRVKGSGEAKAYTLKGTRAVRNQRGLTIRNGRKYAR